LFWINQIFLGGNITFFFSFFLFPFSLILARYRILYIISIYLILNTKRLKNEVVAFRRQGDMIIMIKLIFGDLILNVISAYAPQVSLSDDVKR
jgi:hypothetical protein